MRTDSPSLLGTNTRLLHGSPSPSPGTSPHTVHRYRDSIVRLLRFLSQQRRKSITGLDLTDLDPRGILAFLSHLEQERKNHVSTRNGRLSAIHAFFHFVAMRNPEHLELAQRVLGIPFKRARQRAIDYLEYDEIDTILKTINRTTPQGVRDYALLATLFNTGGRVQEIADLRACDLQLTKPFQVRLFGKGRKERYCPLWPQTATVLRAFCYQRNLDLRSESRVFLNHRSQPLTRFGIRYILARCLALACASAPNLRKKRLHPHSVRHSTGVALLKSGVDLSSISHLLGHARPTTTNRYATVHPQMKRLAIAKVKPVPRRSRTPWKKPHDLAWSGAVRNGPALLAGLLRCGRCGRALQVCYVRSKQHGLLPRYWCAGDRGQQMVRSCITFAGTRVDQVVAIEVLEALRPLACRPRSMHWIVLRIRPMKSGVHWSSPFRRRAMKPAASNGSIRQRNRRTVWLLPNWKSDGTTPHYNTRH